MSRKLGGFLGIPVYSVDKIYWLAGWKIRDRKSFRSLHEKWLDKDSWIIDGVGHWDDMEKRISESDVVIFLDVPVDECRKRAKQRIEEERHEPNPDITLGCEYGKVEELQMEVIEHFHFELRPKLLKYLSRMSPEKVRVIGSLSELDLTV